MLIQEPFGAQSPADILGRLRDPSRRTHLGGAPPTPWGWEKPCIEKVRKSRGFPPGRKPGRKRVRVSLYGTGGAGSTGTFSVNSVLTQSADTHP